jgi:hypothetical protein
MAGFVVQVGGVATVVELGGVATLRPRSLQACWTRADIVTVGIVLSQICVHVAHSRLAYSKIDTADVTATSWPRLERAA